MRPLLLLLLAVLSQEDAARQGYLDKVRACVNEPRLSEADLEGVSEAIQALVATGRPEVFALLAEDARKVSKRISDSSEELAGKRVEQERLSDEISDLEGEERKKAEEKLKELERRIGELEELLGPLQKLRDLLNQGLLDAHERMPADPDATFDALMRDFKQDSADVLEEEREVEDLRARLQNLRDRLPSVTDEDEKYELEKNGARLASRLERREGTLRERKALRERRIRAIAALYPMLSKPRQDALRADIRKGLDDDTPWPERVLLVEIVSYLPLDDAHEQVLSCLKRASRKRRELEKELEPLRVTYERALKAYQDYARGSGGMMTQGIANAEAKARQDLQRQSRLVYGEGRVMDAAADALGRAVSQAPEEERKKAEKALLQAVEREKDPDVRVRAITALGYLDGEEAVSTLLGIVEKDRDLETRLIALDALADHGREAVVPLCIEKLLRDTDWRVRAAAMRALVKVPRKEAIPALIESVGSEVGRLIDDAEQALIALTGRTFNGEARLWREWWTRNKDSFTLGPVADAGGDAPASEGGVKSWKDAPGHVSFYGIKTRSKRILFVLDRSGSMNEPIGKGVTGSDATIKIEAAKQQLKSAIAAMEDGDMFNIITYAADVTRWQKRMQKMSKNVRKKVEKYIDRDIEAVGATNIYDALAEAFRLAGIGAQDRAYESNVDTIFFLSDGNPTNGEVQDPEEILKRVREWNRISRVVVHTVGVGKDHDASFMRRLAEQNGGQYVAR